MLIFFKEGRLRKKVGLLFERIVVNGARALGSFEKRHCGDGEIWNFNILYGKREKSSLISWRRSLKSLYS